MSHKKPDNSKSRNRLKLGNKIIHEPDQTIYNFLVKYSDATRYERMPGLQEACTERDCGTDARLTPGSLEEG